MRVGVRNLLRLPPRGVRVAIDEGLFLRIVRHNPTPHPSCLRFRSGNPPSGSQHSYFTALAKNSHLRTVFTALRAAASRPEGEGFKTVSHRGQVFAVVVYDCFRFCRRGFLGAEPPRASVPARICFVPVLLRGISRWRAAAGKCAGAGMFRAGSIAGDFSTNARNDIVLVWFYNVISTGVRTTVRT